MQVVTVTTKVVKVVSLIPTRWSRGNSMVVGFTTTYVISSYHHQCCEFESRSWRGHLDKTLREKFVSDLLHFGGFLRVLPVSSINTTDSNNITDILVKVALSTITISHSRWRVLDISLPVCDSVCQ